MSRGKEIRNRVCAISYDDFRVARMLRMRQRVVGDEGEKICRSQIMADFLYPVKKLGVYS